MLNAHNSRVFVVFLLLSFLLIDALKLNLHKYKRKQKYYKYYLRNFQKFFPLAPIHLF